MKRVHNRRSKQNCRKGRLSISIEYLKRIRVPNTGVIWKTAVIITVNCMLRKCRELLLASMLQVPDQRPSILVILESLECVFLGLQKHCWKRAHPSRTKYILFTLVLIMLAHNKRRPTLVCCAALRLVLFKGLDSWCNCEF